ncbi:hypothetical protein LTR91_021503 [Friedmanniomyces endolithicus]|uniref:U4/U6.U5 small nuclear ribonucleoprotein 27kDa protein domain-containing protein n=1 Tax=Friedmanniomyces endolithicus TaxID=329885 RepID=A0AAN6H6M9_9PEZI|nr:hypothetical protein LTR94_021182 [Friedmanniomyces endolithicus]KAK0772457.1 hypothetical protein LTR59_015661 [Friedmanniomyces endolithicus]KAK0777456.1 hypothetical protein LTR38_015143 [Friedmanniomyces endolithicus]KAK0779959.1 hypothetical protein LTR75_015192 [Friedmanniomyces endolithicus]KAK0828403.1 hypothetical protein LTR03_016546 [Friedmanniomyces endolithicus]
MDPDTRRDDSKHKPRYERDRSRSPHRERRDDRRRDRSPFRGNGARGRGGGRGGGGGGGGAPPYRSDRDSHNRARDNNTRRPSDTPPPPSHRGGGRGGGPNSSRQTYPSGPRGSAHHHPTSSRPHQRPAAPEVNMELLEGEDEEAFLARIMGFPSFRSTKNTKVPGNERNFAVSKVKKAEYRQYMNRVGGFNRPLSPTRGPA